MAAIPTKRLATILMICGLIGGIGVRVAAIQTDDPVLEQAAATNHSGYLIKPYRDKELQAALKAALYRRTARQKDLGSV